MNRFPTAVFSWANICYWPASRGGNSPKNIAACIEAIPVQTLTIPDEQFLKAERMESRQR
jgi:hypothetical protein